MIVENMNIEFKYKYMDIKQRSQTMPYGAKHHHTAKKSPPTFSGIILISET